jgi:ubiquinone/menaquinone biosynthesis C-methylase UbiE
MVVNRRRDEHAIARRENELRDWFTSGKDTLMREIDGLDIGWGGSQRWVTSKMPDIAGLHLDFACGYGTFLAQLGWRFPRAILFGLNIEYAGPHASITRLLCRAGVRVSLVQADAQAMPFKDRCFASVSCFLGLQDIKIGFGEDGIGKSVSEAVRVLRPGGYLILVDEFTFDALLTLSSREGMRTILKDEFALNVKWNRPVAETAIKLYSKGWAAQSRVTNAKQKESVRIATYKRLKADMEQQLRNKGFYVPHAPVRMVVAAKNQRNLNIAV